MTFKEYVDSLVDAMNDYIVPVIMALALITFIWGVFTHFFLHADDETKRTEGRQFVLWGILGLTLLFSVWSVVNIMLSTLGISP